MMLWDLPRRTDNTNYTFTKHLTYMNTCKAQMIRNRPFSLTTGKTAFDFQEE